MQVPSLRLTGAMLSHQGCVRTNNEDVVCYELPHGNDALATHGALAIVADGMGGEAAGEVASRLAADAIRDHFYAAERSIPEALAAGIAAANEAIYHHSQANPECAGMGTTCTVIAMRDDHLYLGHVGDSRAYILRARELHQISVDHSLVAAMVRDGTLTREEAAVSPDRNIILQALGTNPTVEPLVWNEGMPLHVADVVVLCSDGLSDLVQDDEIARAVGERSPYEACEALIDAALAAGGHDNVSVGVFVVSAAVAQPARPRDTREVHVTREVSLLGVQDKAP